MVRGAGSWHFNDLTAATGAPAISNDELVWGAALDGYAFEGQRTQHVVYGAFPHIYELWWDSSGWHVNDLVAAAGAPNELESGSLRGFADEAEGTQHVFYTAADEHIVELRWEAGHWSWTDLTAQTGAPGNASPLTAYLVESRGIRNVVYFAATDQHFHELWHDAGGWHSDGLGVTGHHPFGYVVNADGTQHVAYIGPSDHVWEAWWSNGDNHWDDVSSETGAPDAASGVTGYVVEPAGTRHLFYLGTTGHVHELRRDANGWAWTDLTEAAAAPAATGPNPPGYGSYRTPTGYVVGGTKHVFYPSGDEGHIHELWSSQPGVWRWIDLSAATDSPGTGPGGNALAAYVFDADGTQHVVYAAADGHIHELWWRSDIVPIHPPLVNLP